MQVTPYLNFGGRTGEALDFYKKAIGAKIGMRMRFDEMPPGQPAMGPPPPGDKIMHASFTVGDSVVFASDADCAGTAEFKGITLSLSARTTAQAEKLFEALAAGGKVAMPMTETFFAKRFGMLSDKFGVHWMVIVEKPMPAAGKKAAPGKKAAKSAA